MSETPTTYSGFVNEILTIINIVIAALLAFTFVYFIWKMIDSWILSAGDETKRADGKKYALAAIVAFVLMISTWGIVNMIRASFFG